MAGRLWQRKVAVSVCTVCANSCGKGVAKGCGKGVGKDVEEQIYMISASLHDLVFTPLLPSLQIGGQTVGSETHQDREALMSTLSCAMVSDAVAACMHL